MALTKKEHAALYRDRHKDRINERARKAYEANPQHFAAIKRKSRYGISPEQSAFLLSQGKCACCGSLDPKEARGWHIDHDHDTKEIRGILCRPCNLLLGALGDNLAGLEENYIRLRKYLEETAKETKRLLSEIGAIKV